MVELLISIGLFSVIVSVAVGGYVNAIRTQQRTTALLATHSNIGLVLEQMMREMRTGFEFCASPLIGCASGRLVFKNANEQLVQYCLSEAGIFRQTSLVRSCEEGEKITANNIAVQYLDFFVSGTEPDDGRQTRVTITIGVSAAQGAGLRDIPGVSGVLKLQTTVSPRILGS